MTPQQRARETRARRAEALAEREARIKTGEARSALVRSAGVALGHAGAALAIGAAFGAGSFLAMKGAGLTHRALTERSYRRASRRGARGDATPKPPTHKHRKDADFRVPGSASSAGTALGTNRDGSSLNSSRGTTPSQSPRVSAPAGSPHEEDLDDVDLVSPLHTQRSDENEEKKRHAKGGALRPRELKKPPGVPRLRLRGAIEVHACGVVLHRERARHGLARRAFVQVERRRRRRVAPLLRRARELLEAPATLLGAPVRAFERRGGGEDVGD